MCTLDLRSFPCKPHCIVQSEHLKFFKIKKRIQVCTFWIGFSISETSTASQGVSGRCWDCPAYAANNSATDGDNACWTPYKKIDNEQFQPWI